MDRDKTATAPRVKRIEMAERIADSLLECGRAQIPLRDLAARLGTSDRMLLYYFSDKADLIRCSLEIVSARLTALLAGALPTGAPAPGALAEDALHLLLSEALSPYMAVWGDLVARAGRREEPFRLIAEAIMAGWQAWIEGRLDGVDQVERSRVAAAILVMLEGARQLESIRPGAAQGALDILIGGFDRKERSAALPSSE
jgi:AcrR family transcriptional regulator